MLKEVTYTAKLCDVEGCGHTMCRTCLSCGKMFCYEHAEQLAVEYRADPYCMQSLDGCYCRTCDDVLRAAGNDPLYSLYRRQAKLTEERKAYHENADKESKEITERITKMLRPAKEPK